MKVLQIAVSPALTSFLPAQWPHVTLDKNVQAAGLAAIVVSKDDEHEQRIAQQLCEEVGLDIPIVMIDGDSDKVATRAQIADMATQYEHDNVPPFLSDLIDFADHRPVSFTTPGHHNGRYFAKGPAGVVFNKFFGENLLYADTSDTVTELGDTMTHAGTPLLAEQLAAKVYHADKVYFCPNGTTGSNDICASAVLRPGDLVLFDRNNHKSLYNGALLMNGVIPVYMPTDRNALGLIGEMDAKAFDEQYLRQEIAKVAPEKTNEKRPFRMAVVQAETYDGVYYNAKWVLDRIGKLCDYILFDCAWGGFEQFLQVMQPYSPLAMPLGPDDPGILVTQSLHKQQVGMGQASQILKKDHHIKGQKRYVDHKHFNSAYLKYVTSSYNYPLYASMTVNSYLANSPGNNNWWLDILKRSIEWRKRLLRQSKLFKPLVPLTVDGQPWQDIDTETLATQAKYWQLQPDNLWHGFTKVGENQVMIDPLKLTIATPGVDIANNQYQMTGIPGPVVAEFLTEHHILKAKADLNSLLFLLTPGDTDSDLDALFDALMLFEKYYLANAPLTVALPKLSKQYAQRYQGYTLKQLCQEMHAYYRDHHTFQLQQALFAKPNMQNYTMTPIDADLAFRHNEGELVSLDDVVGRVALEGALPYPPGVFIVAPGEKWQTVDRDYFQVLVGAMERFAGFVPEIQGVYYQMDEHGKIHVQCEVLATKENK